MKMVVDKASLVSVADAIREKGGTSESLEFPNGFVSAVNAIESGGGEDTLRARLTNTLTEYTIYDAVSLPTHCFNGCSNLEKFIAPNLISTARNYVFYGCANLNHIDMGRITAFSPIDTNGLHRINTIILRNTETVVSLTSVFTNNSSITKEDFVSAGKPYYCYFYVPKALVEEYKVATNWSNYANRFRAIEDYPEITGGVI